MSTNADPIPITSAASVLSPTQIVQAFIRALEELDFDRALTLCAPDIRWVNAPLTTASNKEQFDKALRAMFKMVTRFEVQCREIYEREDGVVHTDRIDIAEGNGLKMELRVKGEFRVEDGLVTEWIDRFSWREAIGDIVKSLPAMIAFRLRK
jgi:limonene-1,2-epoxide hydrolase